MNNKDRIVLITGVSREEGIGFGLAQAMARQGMQVIITARKEERAQALAKKLATEGLQVATGQLDITDDGAIAALVDRLRREYGRLDSLVNNASYPLDFGIHLLDTDLAAAGRTMETTLFGTWRVIKALYPLLRASSAGRIVNISSAAGSFGDPVFGLGVHPAIVTSYGLAKLALNGLTVKLARKLRGESVLVNAVCPGFVATAPGMTDMGARPVSEAVDGIIWAATLPEDGPSGGFFRDKEPLSW